MPRVKRRQREPCDCLDCGDSESPTPAAPAPAVPQEALACLIFVTVPSDHLDELTAIDSVVRDGCCGLVSLRAAAGGLLMLCGQQAAAQSTQASKGCAQVPAVCQTSSGS